MSASTHTLYPDSNPLAQTLSDLSTTTLRGACPLEQRTALWLIQQRRVPLNRLQRAQIYEHGTALLDVQQALLRAIRDRGIHSRSIAALRTRSALLRAEYRQLITRIRAERAVSALQMARKAIAAGQLLGAA